MKALKSFKYKKYAGIAGKEFKCDNKEVVKKLVGLKLISGEPVEKLK